MKSRFTLRVYIGILLAFLMTTGCSIQSARPDVTILVDDLPISATSDTVFSPGAPFVSFQVSGKELLSLPFSEPHNVVIRQPDGQENTIRMTGSSVQMAEATCPNHDCIQMGEITLENLELRAMGGFIVCLPHQITVEVRRP